MDTTTAKRIITAIAANKGWTKSSNSILKKIESSVAQKTFWKQNI